jgi:GNAT superfamily N-acetyltransferase
VIRPAHRDDFARLQAIEVAAGAAFRDVGMPEIADDDPPSLDTLAAYCAAGRAWVVADADADGEPALGYVLVDVVDGCAHVEQVSVHPDAARRRLGAQLLDHVGAWAASSGLAAVTLTTFRAVAWNAPYYERCGFRVLADDELGPELLAVRDLESAHGLDPSQRVCMRRDWGDDVVSRRRGS